MSQATIKPKGLHHAAYTTRDAEATYEFYTNKLGFPLLRTENHLQGDGYFRHFFFGIGGGEALAFFQIDGVGEQPDYKTDVSTSLGLPQWTNHIAFALESMEELEGKTRELHDRGIEDILQIDHGWCTSIYMNDPNGIMVEFCVTTNASEFGEQDEAEALRLMRLPHAEIAAETRKETSDAERV